MPDRRHDHELREAIGRYRLMAIEARTDAARATTEAARTQMIANAQQWDALASELAGRPAPEDPN